MALPIIDHPIYEISLPSSGKPVKFRPFLVKEKKILMMAVESKSASEMISAAKQIVNNCTFNKFDVDVAAMFDIQYLYLKIRAKSMGETSEFIVECPHCKTSNQIVVDLDKIEVSKDPNHTNKIMFSPKIGVIMRYPDIGVESIMDGNKSDIEKEIDTLISCIDYIFDGEDITYTKDVEHTELVEFVESLSPENYDKLINFIETMPKLHHEHKYTCSKCEKEVNLLFDSMSDFFG